VLPNEPAHFFNPHLPVASSTAPQSGTGSGASLGSGVSGAAAAASTAAGCGAAAAAVGGGAGSAPRSIVSAVHEDHVQSQRRATSM
jgi:hypothetical protein